jgi:tetratricopeptide (TPR) repeat protein
MRTANTLFPAILAALALGTGPTRALDREPLAGASLDSVPESARLIAREAKDFFDHGEFHDAEISYEKALALAPDDDFILTHLGLIRFKLGNPWGAEEALKKAIAAAPADSFARTSLGIIYYQQARYDDAIEQLTKALAIDPKIPQAHNYLAISGSMKGWRAYAEKQLLAAIALDPKYSDAQFNLAVFYATGQPPDRKKAKEYYTRAIKLGSEPDPAMEQLLK